MRKNEERTRQLGTVKINAKEVRRALSDLGIPLSKASREMGYADDYLSNRLNEDGCVPVIVEQILRYKYGIGKEEPGKRQDIPGQLSLEGIEPEKKREADPQDKMIAAIRESGTHVSAEAHAQHVKDFHHAMCVKYKDVNGDMARGLLRAGEAEAWARVLMEDLGLVPEGGKA